MAGAGAAGTERVALVTGGTGALGSAVVARLLTDGMAVHVTWQTEREVEHLRKSLGANAGRPVLHRVDVTSDAEVIALAKSLDEAGTPVAVLVNVVGGFTFARLEDTDAAAWNEMMATNATSAFLCCRAFAPAMRRQRWGRIVNVASVAALEHGSPGKSAYAAAKAAVLSLTYTLAAELVREGVTANAIVPTTIDTPANRRDMPDADTATWLPAAEIGDVIAWLASDAARIVTGSAVMLSLG